MIDARGNMLPHDEVCPDGVTRRVESLRHCGFATSGHPNTQRMWWHDLVDWPEIGLGPATWDWTRHEQCYAHSPDGRRCALPVGHVGYLQIGHRLRNRRRFVKRVTPYWPRTDPRKVAA